MSYRDLGPLGETVFKGLCHAVGLTVHKAEMDRTGWDFLVEFPRAQIDNLPVDMLPPSVECKVQVKATDKRKRRLPITVSNLDRLIKSPIPAFFFFIEFDEKNEPQSAYLTHVGKEIIEKTLRRVRKLDNKGGIDKLNKSTITIHYGETDRLSAITGESLKSEIEKFIPNGVQEYIRTKNEFLNTLGFEDGKYSATITISGVDPLTELVDLTLGVRSEMNLEKLISHHKRFGILSANPDLDTEAGIFSIQANPKKSILRFKEYKFSKPLVSFNASLYISPFNPWLPKDYVKFRVESRFFEFTVEPFNGKVNCSFKPKLDEQNPFDELKNLLKILLISKELEHSIIVELESEDLPSPLNSIAEFRTNDLSHFFSKIGFLDEEYGYSRLNELADMAEFICHQFHISTSDISISIDDLMRFSTTIESFYQVLKVDPKTVKISFSNEEDGFKSDTMAVCTSSMMAVIGSHKIACIFGMVGSLLVEENQCQLTTNKILVGKQFVVPTNVALEQIEIAQGFDEFEEELEKMGLVIIRLE
jgi:hypothetical protein